MYIYIYFYMDLYGYISKHSGMHARYKPLALPVHQMLLQPTLNSWFALMLHSKTPGP